MKATITKTLIKTEKEVGLSSEELLVLRKKIADFSNELLPHLKKIDKKIEIFLGGSLAKGTVIRKKGKYDVDLFILFPYDHASQSDKISENLEKAIKQAGMRYEKLKGSRDYFQVMLDQIICELVPILKIKNANDARNITDISPLHVRYLLTEIKKNKKLPKEIMLAKTFCYAQKVYGAESYIGGFSGYSIEILVTYFRSFRKFIEYFSKTGKKDKIIIDPAKYYKNKQQILDNLNPSKIASPIILIDPVDKTRNVSAALSTEKLNDFISSCKRFIRNPNPGFFIIKEKTEHDFIKRAKANRAELIKLKISTDKDKIDVAGAKINKFLEFLQYSLKKENFKIVNAENSFDENNLSSLTYLILKNPEKEKIVNGPIFNCDEKFIKNFKQKYKKNIFVKNKKYFARTANRFYDFNQFFSNFYRENKQLLKDMSIKEVKIL